MRRAVTALLPAVLFLLLFGNSTVQAQVFGAVIYSGDNSADIAMFDLTNTNFSKVEFYRGAKLLGMVTLNGNDGRIVTDYGIIKGNSYQYQYRAYRTAGGFQDGNLAGYSFFLGGDIQGILTRPDTINMDTDLIDTVEVWPGGHLHFASGADVSWFLGTAGTISAFKVYGSDDVTLQPHGQFSASGGRIYDLNVPLCGGKMGPLKDFTFVGSDVIITSDIESHFDNVTLDWVTDNQRNDYAYIRHYANKIFAKNCLLTHEGQLWGVQEADNMRIVENATIVVSNITNSEVDKGQITIQPKNVPTKMEHCNIIDGNVTISNETVIRYNTIENFGTINISPFAGGFDPADIDGVHINFNHFVRTGGQIGNVSNFQADSIDVRRNYWGQCEGPKPGERATMGKVYLDPFLRAEYPEASYWLELQPDKKNVIANDEDEIIFSAHLFNTLTMADSAGVEIRYRVVIVGDTLMQGTLVTDANGRASLAIRIPPKYSQTTGFSVFFETDLQCIEKAFFLGVEEQTGPDLEIYQAEIIQVLNSSDNIAPNKAFAVKATVSTTESISTPFKVQVEANGNTYDTFHIFDADFLGIDHQFENPLTEVDLPRGQPIVIYFLVNELGFDAGTVEVSVTVDPTDAQNPKGRVEEANEFNNTKVIYSTAVATALGNEGEPEVNVLVQGADGYPGGGLNRLISWADSAANFMHKTWPIKDGQAQFTTAPVVADYSYIGAADTLLNETWQPYLMKAYKEMRRANPAYDRYVMAVQPQWFGTRLDKEEFNHRASQTLSWSGIWDFMVSSADHWKHGVHSLGHSFGLRRDDLDPDNVEQREQYFDNFIGIDVMDGIDVTGGRIMWAGIDNKVSRRMRVKCFMGSSQLPSSSFDYNLWISDVEYSKLFTSMEKFTAEKRSLSKTGTVEKALFIEGSVDSTTKAFDFGPWMRLADATVSPMMDAQYATHTFKVLDGGDQEIATYLYHPTFRALGLDEVDAATGPDPKMASEYFAFVVPCPDEAARVVVERDGNVVAERTISASKPVVSIDFPKNNADVKSEKFQAAWSATDPDGESKFWYTVWLSTNNGGSWKMTQYESLAEADSIIGQANRGGYRLRVVANDGVNTSDTAEVAFSILTSTERIPSPAAFELRQNYPNPFNPSTTLTFTIPVSGDVSLDVFDALGRKVATVVRDYRSAGTYHVAFDAAELSSGSYMAVLRSGTQTASIRMTLAR
ncbi:MAG: T9SS type A sorting domain-containing protein [Bacteroidota bacterium]|nr:T9SS type A sorting domain-containing protein [Bacteroidota bacterium]